ncbi:hypothetical protein MTR_3g077920 [Medicago truncatula]|uniref:Transmembrane protein n=1 Tax=Medicago truncatula TaxID=3880 RepID=G7J5H0_MEDTR|nr:hypothetical protein MTR_3g077920 [Medicago truncatula]
MMIFQYGNFLIMVSLLSIAYHAMIPEEPNLIEGPNFNLVRKWIGPSRIYTFLWKLSHEKFLTNAERKHRCTYVRYLCLSKMLSSTGNHHACA